MPRRERLHVWLHGTRVAELTDPGPGKIGCAYTTEAMDRWDLNVPLLSCSLPLRARRYTDAAPYFRGLLPEGVALAAMASAARVPSFDTFGMLARFGRDVAGAVVIAAEAHEPRSGSVELYDEAYLAQEVAGLEDRPLALHQDSELSLPGLQNKLLLVRTADGWGRPVSGFPSTHILKVEDRRFPGLVAQEAAALTLARAVGLTTVRPDVVEHAGIQCLVVDRFDRVAAPDPTRGEPAAVQPHPVPLRRIHQEDVCQALGVHAEAAQGQAKYEFAGGPGFADVAGLLETFGAESSGQLEKLLMTAVFTVAIGNADAHGKNLSLLHVEPGVVELSPLYDTVPTALFPTLTARAAMQVNGRLQLADVTGADLVAEAGRWRIDAERARAVVERTAGALKAAATGPGCTPQLAALVEQRCERIRTSLPSSAFTGRRSRRPPSARRRTG